MSKVAVKNNPVAAGPDFPADRLSEPVRALAHDLRTPLGSLQSCLNLVLSGEAGSLTPDQKRFLGLARRNIDRLDRMVEGMLTANRSQTRHVPVKRQSVDLGTILTETVHLHQVTAVSRGLEVDDTGLPAHFSARVDPDLVVRILENLLGNALKFTRPGGRIRVRLECPEGYPPDLAGRLARHCGLPVANFTLVVQDNGPGLGPEIQSRVFKPFNRGSSPDGEIRTGTGLGLFITRQLVESHGGRIELKSRPGRGTTVRVILPRDPASEHFQITVEQLAGALAEKGDGGVQPLIGLLNLRAGPDKPSTVRWDVEGFFGREPSGFAKAWEPAPGLWTTAVLDPVNWSRRWTLFASRLGGGLDGTRWEYLAPESKEDQALMGPFGKQLETMVNSGPQGSNTWCGSIPRTSSVATED